MDEVRAQRISKELIGSYVAGWKLLKPLGNGKSALVFLAEKEGISGALKIFDPELIERYGKEIQLERINRECQLIGSHHQSLVKILDGGECERSNFLYVAMELVESTTLADTLNEIPRNNIRELIRQIAEAASFLETKQLLHRDIKPQNISISSDLNNVKLLDLGVLKPINGTNITDEDMRPFIGTLRYASPEFLLRQEDAGINGSRAITFYQIGAVLHDLVMRKQLFDEFSEPFMALGQAVLHETPTIDASDVDHDLILLARNCLVKDPTERLLLVNWDDFRKTPNTEDKHRSARDRVRKRSLIQRPQNQDTPITPDTTIQLTNVLLEKIESIIRFECAGNQAFPRMLIPTRESPMRISVVFDADTRLSLKYPLSITFEGATLGSSTTSVIVTGSARLEESLSISICESHAVQIFRGPIDSESLAEQVSAFLYFCIDKAQAEPDASILVNSREINISNFII